MKRHRKILRRGQVWLLKALENYYFERQARLLNTISTAVADLTTIDDDNFDKRLSKQLMTRNDDYAS